MAATRRTSLDKIDETPMGELDGALGIGIVEPEEDEDEGLDLADEADDDEDDDEPASAAARASAKRLLDLLLEKKAILLEPKAKPSAELIDAMARIVEGSGSPHSRAARLSETILDADEVEELFVDDATLGEILKRW